jgi:hypothetical protein
MEKDLTGKQKEVIKLLGMQKIREVKDLDAYKLSVCHPNSAGMDLGSEELYVALSPDIVAEMDLPIEHRFATFTKDLLSCRDLPVSCGIGTVSMESTPVYWTTVFLFCGRPELRSARLIRRNSGWCREERRTSWTVNGCRRFIFTGCCADRFIRPEKLKC